MSLEQIAIVLLGALCGGLVNGLTGFGTGMTAMGLWLYAVSPPIAATLTILCSIVSQAQTLHLVWRSIRWSTVLPFIIPGVLGVPLGSWALEGINPRLFKVGVGLFLIAYASYALLRREVAGTAWGGRMADGVVGFLSGILGGFAGFSGVFSVVWTDIRGWPREVKRGVLQAFNTAVLAAALLMHAGAGRLTSSFLLAAAVAVPGAILGAVLGGLVYRRLGDLGYQRLVMAFLLASGATLILTSL